MAAKGSANASMPPGALNVRQQKDTYQKLQDHFNVIFNAPCQLFDGYPFQMKDTEGGVTITAIIENFEKEQQDALIKNYNKMANRGKYVNEGRLFTAPALNNLGSAMITEGLKASKLLRVEGGIQFEVKSESPFNHWSPERLMRHVKESECAKFWTHVETYPDFVRQCQIRYDIRPFGGTDVKIVTFEAYRCLPIFIMLWLLRQLECEERSSECGFGKVIIIDTNGLPGNEDDHHLHFSSGLIKWE